MVYPIGANFEPYIRQILPRFLRSEPPLCTVKTPGFTVKTPTFYDRKYQLYGQSPRLSEATKALPNALAPVLFHSSAGFCASPLFKAWKPITVSFRGQLNLVEVRHAVS